ncbi:MAG: signal peptide peptidase SppA [Desulfobacterales bacterium]|jgi:protease-4|nr:signal peptide peptidase SppA [Desulfobacterales bacterium]
MLAFGWKLIGFCRRVVGNIAFIAVIAFLVTLVLMDRRDRLPESAVLVLSPAGALVEQGSEGILANDLLGEDVTAETILRDVIDALNLSREDARIKAVLLDLSKLKHAGLTKLQDVGGAIKQFRKSGKPVIASADFFTQKAYFLAAHSDRIYLNPMGGVLLTGFGIYQNYFRTALDRLLVQLHVFRVGTYKSALEPLMRNSMSEFDREASSALLDVLWASFKADIAKARGIDPETIDDYTNHFSDRLADHSGDSAQLALAFKLVDELKTADEVRQELIELAGEDPSRRTFHQIGFHDYLKAVRSDRKSSEPSPKVGVIVAQGVILDGIQPAGKIGGHSLASLIRQTRKDETIRAVVLRIDSPGGSAFASDTIRREIELVKSAGKPLVVSMGSVAASGGYWIASAAEEIWAAPATVTGSIGIFSAFPTFERSLETVGVFNDGVGTTRLADAFNPSRPMNSAMADALNQIMDRGYRTFLSRVAEGRKMNPSAVERVAEGRVWAGQTARDLGLVDKLGSLDDAIASAAQKAGMEKYTVDYIQQPLSRRERILKQLNELFTGFIRSIIATVAPSPPAILRLLSESLGDDIMQFNDPQGIYAYCMNCQAF